MRLREFIVIGLCCFACACGGGGGGGGGGTGETLRRSTATGVRIIHAGLDATPVSLVIGSGEERKVLQTARYAQTRYYQSLPSGPVELLLERANTPGSLVVRFPTELQPNTEYSILLFGEAEKAGLHTALVEDIAERPAAGRAFVSVFNAYISDTVSVTVGDVSFDGVSFGTTGGFKETAAGPAEVRVTRSDGALLGVFTLELSDRGEATVAILGSRELGVRFFPIYPDLD